MSWGKEYNAMTTKQERKAEEDAAQHRVDMIEAEQDRQTHLVDPLTHPSSGDPPPAISEAGDRLGTVPMTRNAVADQRQAEQEGLEAAEHHQPTKVEKQASKPKARPTPNDPPRGSSAGAAPGKPSSGQPARERSKH